MSLILEFANELALKQKFTGKVQPVTKWRRPHYFQTVNHLKLVKLGLLTSPETCVIQGFRAFLALAYYNQKVSILLALKEVGDVIGTQTIEEIQGVLQDPTEWEELLDGKEITEEQRYEWIEKIKAAMDSADLDKIIAESRRNLITFILAMRCDADWDYEDTDQLSDEEKEAVLAFIEEEEDRLEAPTEELKAPTTVKKL